MDILIKNAQLVNEGTINPGDLLVRKGRIERIDSNISPAHPCQVIDAEGQYLLPGMIDDQVHFREPGLTHKGNIESESRAAVAGGITSYMEMPNTNPTTTTLEALADKYTLAASSSAANYAFYLGASNDNLDQIQRLDPNQACGIKIFMGASTGNMLVDNEETLAGIFRDAPTVITTHCESTPIITENLNQAIARYGKDIPLSEHPNIRSEEACFQSSQLAVSLAREHDAQLHILHISTARELSLFEPGPIEGKQITGEACIHFLHFSSEDYAALGNRIKCNPAIKTKADRMGLLKGLQEGRLDILATDHAPHTAEEKANPSYLKSPAGLPLVQDALLAIFELYHDQVLTLPQVVEKTAHNVAQRFTVKDRGYLREGYWADLVLVNCEQETAVTKERVLSRCGWSPFEGRHFRSCIEATLVNGQIAFMDGQLGELNAARAIEFQRPSR